MEVEMVTKIEDVPGVKVPSPNERVLKVLACPELGAKGDFTILISIISPGSTTGLHTHEGDEYMYMVSGKGESICEDKISEVSSDSFIFAPKDIEHDASLPVTEAFWRAEKPVSVAAASWG